MLFRITIYLLLVSSFCLQTLADEVVIGSPFIANYTRKETKAGSENFVAVQNSKAKMFFGNGRGVLSFDGNNWQLIQVTNQSYVRSLAVDSEDKIYVGAYQEFGYLKLNENGGYCYVSLVNLLPEKLDNIFDIWKVHVYNKRVYFQSYSYVFEYYDGKIKVIRPESEFIFSFIANNHFYLCDKTLGLCKLENNEVILMNNGEFFKGIEINSILPLSETRILIATREKGIYTYENNEIALWNELSNPFFVKNRISSGEIVENGKYAFGTVQSGAIICNSKGEIIEKITTIQGIQDNAVNSILADFDKNIWVLTGLGIDYVEISSTYRVLINGIGSGYASEIFQNKVYFGTNRGLFVSDITKQEKKIDKDISLLPNTVGQIWNISKIDNNLLIGHHNGAYVIENEKAKLISNVNGSWQFFRLSQNEDYILSGTYTGYVLFKIENNTIRFVRKINGFDESCRVSFQDEYGFIWMSHGYKGIYKLKLNANFDEFEEIEFFDKSNSLPSNQNNDIFFYDGEVYITTINGVYSYDYNIKKLVRNNLIEKYLGCSEPLTKVIVSPENEIWNFRNGKIGKLTIINDSVYFNDFHTYSFISDKLISPFENIFWFDKNKLVYGVQDGFIIFNINQSDNKQKNYSVLANSFQAIGKSDKMILGSDFSFDSMNLLEIPYSKNLIQVELGMTFFSNPSTNQFCYSINKGQYSSWTVDNIFEFSHLSEGEYSIVFKGRNYQHDEANPYSVKFTILPPWYRSWIAYSAYFTLFFIVSYIIYFLASKRISKVKSILADKQKREMEIKEKRNQEEKRIAENEIIKVTNEKLQNEIIHKNKELANTANNIIHKNRILNEMKADLKLMGEESKNQFVQRKIKGLIRKVDKEIESDQSHEIFMNSFDKVHENFINRLKKEHPELTPKDLRMCSYLRMNLSTKEIAPMLNISVRGVEISRYRLRKKLYLDHNDNLTEYIISF